MTLIRHIADEDWAGIVALESRTYGELSEERAALESRARSSPGTCLVLDVGNGVAGYVLALPYPMFTYPDLGGVEDQVFRSRNLHLHDLVVAEGFRGRGLAKHLLRHLTATAKALGHERISLIAVMGGRTFWSANGYSAHPEIVLPASYGANAVYMSKAL